MTKKLRMLAATSALSAARRAFLHSSGRVREPTGVAILTNWLFAKLLARLHSKCLLLLEPRACRTHFCMGMTAREVRRHALGCALLGITTSAIFTPRERCTRCRGAYTLSACAARQRLLSCWCLLRLSLGCGVFCPCRSAGTGGMGTGGRSKVGNPDRADCARRAVTARKGQQGKAN